MENFWAGACAPREGGSPETGDPIHTEAPSQAGPKRSFQVSENQAKKGLGGHQTEEAAFLRPLTAQVLWPSDSGLGRGTRAYKPSQHTPPLQHKGQAQVKKYDGADKPSQRAQPLQHRGRAYVAHCSRKHS